MKTTSLTKFATLSLAAIALLTLSTRGQAATLFTSSDLGSTTDTHGAEFGEYFTVGSQNLLVTDLGAYYDSLTESGGETAGNVTVVLYTFGSTPTELTYATIGSGESLDAQGFAYTSSTPVTLLAGQTYAVAEFGTTPHLTGSDASGSSSWDTVGLSPSPSAISTVGATFDGTVFAFNDDPFVAPGVLNNGATILAANIKYTVVPEPSTWALLLAGFTGLVWLGRRHSSQA